MKIKIFQNIWGNWNGYLGKRKVKEFGTDEIGAKLWLKIGEKTLNEKQKRENNNN